MLKQGYDPKISTGLICASGTLGQIIPPSIILIILGDVFQEPVGDLFKAALWPGLSLVAFYVTYIVIVTIIKKELAPPIKLEEMVGSKKNQIFQALKAIIPPLVLIILVLGSILTGVATPTESSAVGGVGAILLAGSRAIGETMIVVMAAGQGANLTWNPLEEVTTVTVQIVMLITGDVEADTAAAPEEEEEGGERQRRMDHVIRWTPPFDSTSTGRAG